MTKTDTKSTVLLKHHLKALKLPTMHNECEKIALLNETTRAVPPITPITWRTCSNSASWS